MSRFQSILIGIILLIGLLAGFLLLRVESLTPALEGEEASEEEAQVATDGPHQGLILGKDQPLQLEVVSQLKGHGKLQLKFFAIKGSETVTPQPGQLQASWKRLGQSYPLTFRIEDKSWIAESLLDEPHSFVLSAKLSQAGQSASYSWEKSENRLELGDKELKESHITFALAGPQTLSDSIELPGKITVNQERFVHITPRIRGTVTRVYKHLGEPIRRGDLLAVLESRELGDLRLDYLAAATRSRQATARHRTEQGFFNNTATLLSALRRGENIDALHRRLLGVAIGSDRQVLISAYADYKLAWQNFEREKKLLPDRATSQAAYQQAEQALHEARAVYEGGLEEISRQRRLSLTERAQEVERLEPEQNMARKKLELLGLTADSESTQFELRSPISGQILSQHIVSGESLEADADAFEIADLSEVWAEMMIPESQLDAVRLRQSVEVVSQTGKYSSPGVVSHLGAVVDEDSRTAEAHAVVLNDGRIWKPGMFVSIQLQSNPYRVPLAVQSSAIQSLEGGKPVVFVRDGEALQAVPVVIGRRTQEWVEIRSGLRAGQSYVSGNSFLLKAELEKALAAEE